MTEKRVFLSKSKITAFEQCPRRLWLETYRKDLIHYDDARQAIFQTGHEVGSIAQQLHPDGVLIGHDDQLSLALEQTSELLFQADRRPLFEATFAYEDVLVRVDLLIPEADGWRICEVKSTASVKPYHLLDLATQVWVAVGAGLTVSRASVQHIDSRFRYDTLGDYRGLFAEADRTQEILPLVNSRQHLVSAAKMTVQGAEPDIATGAHCASPFSCPFYAHCGKDDPPPTAYPVEVLPGQAGKRAAAGLRAAGYGDLRDVPADVTLDGPLQRILDATRTGEAYLDVAVVRAELSGWAFPRYYFDFETVAFTVPRWLGTRPFENVPFQFSATLCTRTARSLMTASLTSAARIRRGPAPRRSWPSSGPWGRWSPTARALSGAACVGSRPGSRISRRASSTSPSGSSTSCRWCGSIIITGTCGALTPSRTCCPPACRSCRTKRWRASRTVARRRRPTRKPCTL